MCRNTVAVALRLNCTMEHIGYVNGSFESMARYSLKSFEKQVPVTLNSNFSSVIGRMRPVASGTKPGTRRTGTAESRKLVATSAIIEEVPQSEVPTKEQFQALLNEKPKVFTQWWHNNEPFNLAFLSDLAQRNRRCQACSLEFPDEVDPESVENLLVAHKEVYQYPHTIKAGKNVWVWSTRAM